MKVFTQMAKHSINKAICSDSYEKLPEAIRKYTDWDYSCHQRYNGCFLKPTFRNMPYRNSFVPEIDIVVSRYEAHTMMHISGRPVKFVRVFMAFWFGILFMIEIFLLVLAITSKLNSMFSVFIPVSMCVFGYLLCKLATKATFHSVVEAIRREYT